MPATDERRDNGKTKPLLRALDELTPELEGMTKGMISVGQHGSTQAWAKVVLKMTPVAAESAKLVELLVIDLAAAISGFQDAATRSADTANEQAKKLTWATKILAGATVVLALATVALVWATLR